ncbi:MAG TPA: amidase, partial [Vicinamibacterales bacterium]|nr:amidase [Vicinamibacterales bacterium]
MDLQGRIDRIEALVEAREPEIQALLPEEGRFDRLRRDARALADRYPDAAARPPLFGLFFGVKDIFHVDGWPTRAGSRLPPEILHGPQATSVSRLLAAGALMLGKTVTTEFAYFTPGPTRNPHNVEHTPGGSSSGSAAAVAAGFCDLALGTQTIGSIIRPAAFCGIVGFKPTFGRIPADGLVACAPSLDHVGALTRDVATLTRAAFVLLPR